MKKALFAVLAAFSLQAAEKPWLILNEDNDYYFKKDSRYMTEDSLRRHVDELAEMQVTHLFLCPSGQRTSYDSKVWEPIWKGLGEPNQDSKGQPTNDIWCVNAKILFDKGIDPYAVWIDQCRKRGLSPWLSPRMNDVHYVSVSNYFRNTTFWKTRVDLRRNPDPASRDWFGCAFNYAHKEVREYHFALIRELLERYDSDGLELDWMRFGRHLTPGKEKEEGIHLTEFVRDARRLANEWSIKRGHPVRIAVRVPTHPDAAAGLGMDAAAWAKEGLVDVIIPSQFFSSADFDIPYGLWKERTAGTNVRIVPGTDNGYQPHPKFPRIGFDLPAYYGWAEALHHKGARDFYLFNIFYLDYLKSFKPLLSEGFKPEALKQAKRRYLVTFKDMVPDGFDTGAQLPKSTDGPAVFTVMAGARPERGTAAVVFACDDNGKDTEAAVFEVAVNGRRQNAVSEVKKQTRSGQKLVFFNVPVAPADLKDGPNEVTVSRIGGTAQRIVWVELQIDEFAGMPVSVRPKVPELQRMLKKGELVFNDRNYVFADLPAELVGKPFLFGSILRPMALKTTVAGDLFVLTPVPDSKNGCWQGAALKKYGFEKRPGTFQLFGNDPQNKVEVYVKRVRAGESFTFRRWCVVANLEVGKSEAEIRTAGKPSEVLYNGIELPMVWPPVDVATTDRSPMRVPYLETPPKVIPIDLGRQLFVDDFLIRTSSLKKVYHKPVKYEGNPVLKPETELELNSKGNAAAVPKGGGVWWDASKKVFRMWYEAGWLHRVAYAESTDGLHWERPILDVVPGTNAALPPEIQPDSWVVIPDPNATDPNQKYKLFLRGPGGDMPGISMTSPDGIHWMNRTATGSCGDRSTAFYNPFRKKWVYSLRSGWRARSRVYRECDDFLEGAKWDQEDTVLWAAADALDAPNAETGDSAQLYNLDAVAYESILLGLFEIHLGPKNEVCEKSGYPKITELNFAYSRDGFHWSRPDRTAHIPASRTNTWDRGYVQSLGNICVIKDDKLWFYYSGFAGNTNKVNVFWQRNGMYDNGSTGVAFLRRDGFVSLEAGAEGGDILTRSVTFRGRNLFVNGFGEITAEVTDTEGKVIEPFTFSGCVPLTGDSTKAILNWKNGDLKKLAGKPVRFRFRVKGGGLYAFWVSADASGRSGGYLAGGGPDYAGLKDD